jgi:uncharacterized protein YigE (DUF2233 family)
MSRRSTLVLLLAICATATSAAEPADTACRSLTFEGARFTVCPYRAGEDQLRLAWKDNAGPLGSLVALQRHLGRSANVRFAMNAGMYHPDQRPVGLYIEDGQTLSPLETAARTGNFYALPNGVFSVEADGAPRITETTVFARTARNPRWASQSGPLLLNAGALHPLATDRTKSLLRNGVGMGPDGEALFVISDDPVTIGRFARLFRDGLQSRDALYFDGGVSSLWVPGHGRRDERKGLGPLLVVLR